MTPLEVILSFISAISIILGIIFSVRSVMREKSKDTKEDASQMSLVMYKLDNIGSTVNDIKADFKASRLDIQDARERILILEQEYKSMYPVVNELRKSFYNDGNDKEGNKNE